MQKGSKEMSCAEGATITIRSAGTFMVYAMENKKRSMILGPLNVNERILRYKLPNDIGTIFVKTEKSTEWTFEWTYIDRSESLDRTPVEMPIGYQQPETLASQMRRFIKDEVSKQAVAENMGSFEEEDDFEMPDELPLTNYEMTDMEEVEEPEVFEKLLEQDEAKTTAKTVDQVEDLVDNPEDAETSEAKKAVDNEA